MGTITKIESSIATFNNITEAIQYLDDKYGRINWTNSLSYLESITIGLMDVYVDNGLRCDPDDTQFSKYQQWEAKYPELHVRLS